MLRTIRICLLVLFLALVGMPKVRAQVTQIPPDWKHVNVCQIRFWIPGNLKNQYVKGIDSCFAEFRNGKMRLAIDSGSFGGAYTKSESNLRFTEETIELEGKTARVYRFDYAEKKSKLRFVAGLSVVLFDAQGIKGQSSETLHMTIEAKSEAELEVANQIFRSIRFDPYFPQLHVW